MEGVRSRRGHVDVGSGVFTCIRACTTLQPCSHIRVKPAVQGAEEEDAQGVHEVPGK